MSPAPSAWALRFIRVRTSHISRAVLLDLPKHLNFSISTQSIKGRSVLIWDFAIFFCLELFPFIFQPQKKLVGFHTIL
jgi:hypothetical protein